MSSSNLTSVSIGVLIDLRIFILVQVECRYFPLFNVFPSSNLILQFYKNSAMISWLLLMVACHLSSIMDADRLIVASSLIEKLSFSESSLDSFTNYYSSYDYSDAASF